MSTAAVVLALVAIVALLGAGRFLLTPVGLMVRLAFSGALGLALLYIVNLVGRFVGFHIGWNPVTGLIAGLLGMPGVLLLTALRYVFA